MQASNAPRCQTCGHPQSLPIRACEACGSECDWGRDDEPEPEDELTAAKRYQALKEE